MQKQKGLIALFIPMALETLFMMLTGMADTVMLSSVSDSAVGAIGTANTYINIFIITFGIISSGMVAVVTQYIGAQKIRAAGQALTVGLSFNAILGGILSAVLFFETDWILRAAGVAPALFSMARDYLRIVGGFCFVNAMISVLSSYLRAFGFTKQSLYATIGANISNLILNAVFLFGCRWGVAGVALATVISRIGNLAFCALWVRLRIHTNDGSAPISYAMILKQIVRIGLPAALETALYNVASALTVRFLNQMDAEGLHITAKTYASQLANFCFCSSVALSQANGLITGWQVGTGKLDECYRKTNKVAIFAILGSAGITVLVAVFAKPLLHLFTGDPVIIDMAAKLIAVDIILEAGRSGSLVYGQALKVSGDAIFPSAIGAVFMYLVMVGGSWLLGIRMGMLSVGVLIAMAADECVRAALMAWRWHSGAWRSKGIFTDPQEVKK